MSTLKSLVLGAALLAGAAMPTGAQQPAPSPPPVTPYGAPIGLDAAKKVMAVAEAEAVKNNWPMAIVIVDSTGHVVMLHKLDNTQYGSIRVAEDKANTALDFRRPSKVFEDLVAQGGLGMRTLGLRAQPRSRVACRSSSREKSSAPSVSAAERRRRTGRWRRLAPRRRRRSRRGDEGVRRQDPRSLPRARISPMYPDGDGPRRFRKPDIVRQERFLASRGHHR